jgi:hypothetical protein
VMRRKAVSAGGDRLYEFNRSRDVSRRTVLGLHPSGRIAQIVNEHRRCGEHDGRPGLG